MVERGGRSDAQSDAPRTLCKQEQSDSAFGRQRTCRAGRRSIDDRCAAALCGAQREHNADDLWRERKRWFFKPVAGFGGKGAYRGDKLTTRVFAEIRRGGYIAQELCQPSERQVSDDSTLKMDIRNYVYAGKVQMLAARLYQGQTTNFRTPGGGFAPVFITPDDADLARAIAAVQLQA